MFSSGPVPSVTPSPAALAAARRLCDRLDPVLTAVGFQRGSVGHTGDEVGVVFCIRHRDFRSRFPTLAPDIDYSDEGACTDLNVYVDVRDDPRLAEAQLDGHGVDDLLADVGRTDLAPQAQTLGQGTLEDDLELLRGLLLEVFGRAASSDTRKEWEPR